MEGIGEPPDLFMKKKSIEEKALEKPQEADERKEEENLKKRREACRSKKSNTALKTEVISSKKFVPNVQYVKEKSKILTLEYTETQKDGASSATATSRTASTFKTPEVHANIPGPCLNSTGIPQRKNSNIQSRKKSKTQKNVVSNPAATSSTAPVKPLEMHVVSLGASLYYTQKGVPHVLKRGTKKSKSEIQVAALERKRRQLERIRNDPTKYEAYKAAEKERSRKRRAEGKIKKIAAMSDSQLRVQRKKWQKSQHESRDRKNQAQGASELRKSKVQAAALERKRSSYVQRIRNDPTKYETYKAAEKERSRKRRAEEKIKKITAMTDKQISDQESHHECRDRKNQVHLAFEVVWLDIPDASDPDDIEDVEEPSFMIS